MSTSELQLSRREFLGTTAAGVGGFSLALGWPEQASAQAEPPKYGAYGMPNGVVENPLVFV